MNFYSVYTSTHKQVHWTIGFDNRPDMQSLQSHLNLNALTDRFSVYLSAYYWSPPTLTFDLLLIYLR